MENNISQEALSNVKLWLEDAKYADYKEEVQALIDAKDWKALEDSFYRHIEFGTAGMRGATGVGPARINKVTIGEAAQAVADYLLTQGGNPSVVVAYDTRLTSPELSKMVAAVLAMNGVLVYYFESFRSTPELSFAIRLLKASAGIVISASHNPPTDNGFKVYWSDGAQVSSPDDKGLLVAFANIRKINYGDFNALKLKDQIKLIGDEVDKEYLDTSLRVNEEYTRFDKKLAKGMKIAYSPLHGAGQTSVLPMLKKVGFDVVTVDAEMVPDGHFPALANNTANPEVDSANAGVIKLMEEAECDLGITTDPDADRLRVTVRTKHGFRSLTGNQMVALAANYLLSKDSEGYICKTIVTTDLIDAVTSLYGTQSYRNLLIGFKYIGRQIREMESTGMRFIMGAEESYGMLVGSQVRDKDAAMGALVLAEFAAELRAGEVSMDLYEFLLEMYARFGVYVEEQVSVMYPGADGFRKMQEVMEKLRKEPLTEVDGLEVSQTIDCLADDTPTADKGDMVILKFEDDWLCRVAVRPSGTEPKLKFYGQWHEAANEEMDIEAQYEDTAQRMRETLEALKEMLLA